jgi:hypothetical protein
MGADKNSSLWLNSAYTPIATPRTHMHKQDPRQGSNKLKGTTKKPRNKKLKQTNKKQSTSSELQKPGRTVRVGPADRPRRGCGPSGHHTRTVRKSTPNQQSRTLNNRTVRDSAADCPHGKSSRGLSEGLSQTVRKPRQNGNQNPIDRTTNS